MRAVDRFIARVDALAPESLTTRELRTRLELLEAELEQLAHDAQHVATETYGQNQIACRPRSPRMTAIEILKAARETLSTPDRWTKKMYAKDATGKSVSYCDPRATCFCVNGALMKAESCFTSPGYLPASEALRVIVGPSIPSWNDAPETTHADVLDALDRAIGSLQ